MILMVLPLPGFSGTDVRRSAAAIALVNPAAEPFLAGMSGDTTVCATKAGRIFRASFPEVAPSFLPLCPPPQAVSSGAPPATAAAATAVEARKLLRLGAEEEFCVIASTLRGAPGHPAGVRRSAAVSSVELA